MGSRGAQRSAGVTAAAMTAAGVVLVVDIPHIVSFVIVAAIDVEVRHVNKGVAMERGWWGGVLWWICACGKSLFNNGNEGGSGANSNGSGRVIKLGVVVALVFDRGGGGTECQDVTGADDTKVPCQSLEAYVANCNKIYKCLMCACTYAYVCIMRAWGAGRGGGGGRSSLALLWELPVCGKRETPPPSDRRLRLCGSSPPSGGPDSDIVDPRMVLRSFSLRHRAPI